MGGPSKWAFQNCPASFTKHGGMPSQESIATTGISAVRTAITPALRNHCASVLVSERKHLDELPGTAGSFVLLGLACRSFQNIN